jgi:tRNA(Ile)-lysidine synthase
MTDGSAERGVGGPGYAVVELTRAAISRYRMLEPEDRVLVALSGGPDSTCLLDVLIRLRKQLGHELAVAHVDHGLSSESQEVAANIARAVAEAGLEVHLIRAPDLSGPNLHARARDFRYRFFETIAEQWGATRTATGHTLDDRVETTLARLIHGSGTDGLAGLPPMDKKRIRPLIGVRRQETREYCDANGLHYYDDPANEDERFERVVVRRAIVSAIEDRWGPGATRAMAVSADRLWDDARAVNDLADRLYEGITKKTEDAISFDRGAMSETPRAFRRRLLERAVGRVRDRSGGIDAAVDFLDRGIDGSHEAGFSVASGIEIAITRDQVVVRRSGDEPPG